MFFAPALVVSNGTLIAVAAVVFIICALFWLFGLRR